MGGHRSGSKKAILVPKPNNSEGMRRQQAKSGFGTAVESGLGMDNFVEGAVRAGCIYNYVLSIFPHSLNNSST